MLEKEHETVEPQATEVMRSTAVLARAVILSAMLGVVLLAILPGLAGTSSPRGSADEALPALLGLVRGV